MSTLTHIITAKWIIPILPRKKVLLDSALVIQGGKIIDICKRKSAIKKYPKAQITEKNEHAILPGFINSHTHAAMSLFRGFADDVPLQQWLEKHIWPAESKWVDKDFIRDGTELAICEMLLNGITCFSDMYYFPDSVAYTAQKMGIRACVGLIAIEHPTVWANNSDEYLEKGLRVNDEVRSLSLITTAFAPHAPYTTTNNTLERILTYADELQIPIHTHLHETQFEITQSQQQFNMRPLARFHSLGLLNPRLIAVHMVHVNEEEIELCAEQGVQVVHCPKSNLKLASGIAPTAAFLQAGVNLSLGSDGAASNNRLDILSEAQYAALLAKTHTQDASAVPAWQALEMATLNGAKALNIEDKVGSLEVGKAADCIAVDLSQIQTTPLYNPISHIVYGAHAGHVSDVWVAGQHIVKERAFTEINLEHIQLKAQQWQSKIQL